MNDEGPRILTKVNLFQDFLGIAPTPLQTEAAAATATNACISVCAAEDQETDTLLCALTLWWASIIGSSRITVLVGHEERARELLRRIHTMQAAVPRNWRRPFATSKSRWGDWHMGSFTGAGFVYTMPEVDEETIDWSAVVIVDRTFRRTDHTYARLAEHRRKATTPTRYLFLSDAKQCHSSLADLWVGQFFPDIVTLKGSAPDEGVAPLDHPDLL